MFVIFLSFELKPANQSGILNLIFYLPGPYTLIAIGHDCTTGLSKLIMLHSRDYELTCSFFLLFLSNCFAFGILRSPAFCYFDVPVWFLIR